MGDQRSTVGVLRTGGKDLGGKNEAFPMHERIGGIFPYREGENCGSTRLSASMAFPNTDASATRGVQSSTTRARLSSFTIPENLY